MDNDLSRALVMMADAIQNLADSQAMLIHNTGAIKSELRIQSALVAKSVENQKRRAAEMMTNAKAIAEKTADAGNGGDPGPELPPKVPPAGNGGEPGARSGR